MIKDVITETIKELLKKELLNTFFKEIVMELKEVFFKLSDKLLKKFKRFLKKWLKKLK